MKDIKVLAAVLLVGCFAGAISAPVLQKEIWTKSLNITNSKIKGVGKFNVDADGRVELRMFSSAQNSFSIIVDDASALGVAGKNGKARLVLGVNSEGNPFLFVVNAKGTKKIWGISVDENDVVRKYGH